MSAPPECPFPVSYSPAFDIPTERVAAVFTDLATFCYGQGLGEKAMRDFAEREENRVRWEGYAVRPGYVFSKDSAGWVGVLLGSNYAVREDLLAAAMVDTALNGAEEWVLDNKTIIARAEELAGQKPT